MITPRTEIVLYIQNKKNPYRNFFLFVFFCFFLQRLESLKKYFHKKKIVEYEQQKKSRRFGERKK